MLLLHGTPLLIALKTRWRLSIKNSRAMPPPCCKERQLAPTPSCWAGRSIFETKTNNIYTYDGSDVSLTQLVGV